MRSAGLPIEVLKKYIELFNMGDNTVEERRQILINERKKLIEKRDAIQNTIDRLDYKIEIYYKNMCEKQKELLK